MNELLSHLKLLYRDIKEISPDIIILLNDNYKIGLYLYGTIIDNIDSFVIYPYNIVSVVLLDNSRVHLYQGNTLVDSYSNKDITIYPALSFALSYIIKNCPNILNDIYPATVYDVQVSSGELSVSSYNYTKTNRSINGVDVICITHSAIEKLPNFIIYNNQVHEIPHYMRLSDVLIYGYNVIAREEGFVITEIISGAETFIRFNNTPDISSIVKNIYRLDIVDTPTKTMFILRHSLLLFNYNPVLQPIIEIYKDIPRIVLSYGDIIESSLTMIKYDQQKDIYVWSDCDGDVYLTGRKIKLASKNLKLIAYLGLYLITDSFVYDSKNEAIYETSIKQVELYNVKSSFAEQRNIVVLISNDCKYYITLDGIVAQFYFNQKSEPSILQIKRDYVIIDSHGSLLSEYISSRLDEARRELHHAVSARCKPITSSKAEVIDYKLVDMQPIKSDRSIDAPCLTGTSETSSKSYSGFRFNKLNL